MVYKVRKYNDCKGKEYFGSVVANSEEEARTEALAQMRKLNGYKVEILSSKPQETFSAAEDFAARYGVDPVQYEEE